MLDHRIRPWIDPPLNWLAHLLWRCGLQPNTVTIVGFVFGILGCLAIVYHAYDTALALILLNRLADGLDGALARKTRMTDLGGFLDIVLDTIFYSAVPFAFAIAQPSNALPAAFVIFSFVGTGGSFLAYSIIAAKRKMQTTRSGKKSIFYAAGLMEGTETVLFLILVCLFPESFPLLAWVFGTLCWITTQLRIFAGIAVFRKEPS